MTRFAFLTVCRASEAFLSEWRNATSTNIIFEGTKNSETRKIPPTGHLADLLAEIPRGNSTAPVFVKTDGKPYREAPSAFATTVKALGLNEGRTPLDRTTFHSARRCYGIGKISEFTFADGCNGLESSRNGPTSHAWQ